MLIEEIDKRKAQKKQQPDEIEGDVRVGYAIIASVALAVTNFTFAVCARIQYNQEELWWPSFMQTLKTVPLLGVVVYLLHPFETKLVNGAAFVASVGFGCTIVWILNNEGYYASMSKTPQLGTVWVWMVIEMHYALGALSLLAVGVYSWWNDYRLM